MCIAKLWLSSGYSVIEIWFHTVEMCFLLFGLFWGSIVRLSFENFKLFVMNNLIYFWTYFWFGFFWREVLHLFYILVFYQKNYDWNIFLIFLSRYEIVLVHVHTNTLCGCFGLAHIWKWCFGDCRKLRRSTRCLYRHEFIVCKIFRFGFCYCSK